jgi:hypothetical protein
VQRIRRGFCACTRPAPFPPATSPRTSA